MRGILPLLALMLALPAAFRPAAAQDIFGALRPGPGRATSGMIVQAARVSDGVVVAQTTIAESDRYHLTVPLDSLTLRVLQVGQQPQVFAALRMDSGGRREVHATLPNAPVVITLPRRVDTRCRVRPAETEPVAQLFTEARTALMTTVPAVRTRYRLLVEQQNVRGERVGAVRGWELTSGGYFTVQPFRVTGHTVFRPLESASPEVLLEGGFVGRDTDDGTPLYRVPHLELFEDDYFLSDYCLHLVEGKGERAEWIGVGFRPVQSDPRITQIEGTLWLDRATHALQRLEYGYAGLEPAVARTKPGGWIAFTEMPAGVWFVSGWEIRLPRVTPSSAADMLAGAARETVTGVQVARGEVLVMSMWRQMRYTTGAQERMDLSGTLVSDTVPAHGDPARCPAGTGASVYGTALGRPDVEVRVDWHAQGQGMQRGVRTDAEGRYQICGVPPDRPVTLSVRSGGRVLGRTMLRVTPARGTARVEMQWPSGGMTIPEPFGPDGRIDYPADTLRGDGPLSLLRVEDRQHRPLDWASVEIADGRVLRVEGEGRVAIGHTASLALSVRVRAMSGFYRYDRVITRATPDDPWVVTLTEDLRHRHIAISDPTRPIRVVDTDGVPVPHAVISSGGRIRDFTDSAGYARVSGGDSLVQLFRAQRIGYRTHDGLVRRAVVADLFTVVLTPERRDHDAALRSAALSRTGFYERWTWGGRTRRITPEEIDLRIGEGLSGLLGSLLLGSKNPALPLVHIGRRCPVPLLVDGRTMADHFLRRYVRARDVLAIEVYESMTDVPAELLPPVDHGSCGLVAVWTGPRR